MPGCILLSDRAPRTGLPELHRLQHPDHAVLPDAAGGGAAGGAVSPVCSRPGALQGADCAGLVGHPGVPVLCGQYADHQRCGPDHLRPPGHDDAGDGQSAETAVLCCGADDHCGQSGQYVHPHRQPPESLSVLPVRPVSAGVSGAHRAIYSGRGPAAPAVRPLRLRARNAVHPPGGGAATPPGTGVFLSRPLSAVCGGGGRNGAPWGPAGSGDGPSAVEGPEALCPDRLFSAVYLRVLFLSL